MPRYARAARPRRKGTDLFGAPPHPENKSVPFSHPFLTAVRGRGRGAIQAHDGELLDLSWWRQRFRPAEEDHEEEGEEEANDEQAQKAQQPSAGDSFAVISAAAVTNR